MAEMMLPPVEIDNDLGIELNLKRKAATSAVTSATTSVAFRAAPAAIKASKDYLLNRGAKEVAVGTTKILAPEASGAVASTFVPGFGFFIGLGMNSLKFYQEFKSIQTFAENSDAGTMYLLFDPHARGLALRAITDFAINTGVDCLSFIPLFGGTADFIVSTAVRGGLLARDIADPHVVNLTNELQSAIDGGTPLSLNRMALTIQKMAEETNPKLAAEIKTAIEQKDPAVAMTLYEMAEAMSANRSAAGTLKYAIESGELMQHLQQERAKTGQMLGIQTLAGAPVAETKLLSAEVESLKKKLGVREKMLESDERETAGRLADHGLQTRGNPQAEPKKPVITGKRVAAAAAVYVAHKTGALGKGVEAVKNSEIAKRVSPSIESLGRKLDGTKEKAATVVGAAKDKAGKAKDAFGAKVNDAINHFRPDPVSSVSPSQATAAAATGFNAAKGFGKAASADFMSDLANREQISQAMKGLKNVTIDSGSGAVVAQATPAIENLKPVTPKGGRG